MRMDGENGAKVRALKTVKVTRVQKRGQGGLVLKKITTLEYQYTRGTDGKFTGLSFPF